MDKMIGRNVVKWDLDETDTLATALRGHLKKKKSLLNGCKRNGPKDQSWLLNWG